jgi:hypothetical protein
MTIRLCLGLRLELRLQQLTALLELNFAHSRAGRIYMAERTKRPLLECTTPAFPDVAIRTCFVIQCNHHQRKGSETVYGAQCSAFISRRSNLGVRTTHSVWQRSSFPTCWQNCLQGLFLEVALLTTCDTCSIEASQNCGWIGFTHTKTTHCSSLPTHCPNMIGFVSLNIEPLPALSNSGLSS